jgi:hypothetical protein
MELGCKKVKSIKRELKIEVFEGRGYRYLRYWYNE